MEDCLIPLVSEADIAIRVQAIAQAITRDYAQRPPVLVGILKGSFIFLADLVRCLEIPIAGIEFIRLSSYGSGMVSSGQVHIHLGLRASAIENQPVIIVEDIVDTGLTTQRAMAYLHSLQPASLALCALLDKPDRRQVPVTIDYLGLTIPDCFVVGYGIDFNQQYRQLPALYRVATPVTAPTQPTLPQEAEIGEAGLLD
ncbi:hypoxanthine phosphoribosyltransferase [Trichothermofontia sp.]